jgi:hypothetical protein
MKKLTGIMIYFITVVISFFTCVAVAFLLHLGFVFTYDDGSVAIGVVVLVAEDLGFVIQL